MTATITFSGHELLATMPNGRVIARDWEEPITARTDSWEIAEAMFEADEIVSVDHDGSCVHVELNWQLYTEREHNAEL